MRALIASLDSLRCPFWLMDAFSSDYNLEKLVVFVDST